MPARKKVSRKKTAPRKAKKVYYCIPCGMEVTVSKAGMGTSTLMCCGEPMKVKRR